MSEPGEQRPPFPCPTPWTCGPNLCTGGCGADPTLRDNDLIECSVRDPFTGYEIKERM